MNLGQDVSDLDVVATANFFFYINTYNIRGVTYLNSFITFADSYTCTFIK